MPEDNFAIALVKDDGNILVRYPAIATSNSKVGSDSPFLQTLLARYSLLSTRCSRLNYASR